MMRRQTIRQLKDAARIEDVIARCGVRLMQAGERFKAHCPFVDHQDRTPSFFVFPGTQTFQCFGACGRGGDVLDFLQEWYGYTFPEAVERLAENQIGADAAPAHLTASPSNTRVRGRAIRYVPNSQAGDSDSLAEHTSVLTVAGDIYHRCLLRQPRILSYAYERGILRETVQQQRLGYADGRTFPAYASTHSSLWEAARRAGLLGADGRETLAGRLVFPEVRDEAFWYLIGRAVPPHTSKYKYLGLSIAKPLIGYGEAKKRMQAERPRRRGLQVTEGTVDRIVALQWGLPVYPLALAAAWPSARQIGELLDLYECSGGAAILLALDDDEAGHAATVALLNTLRKPGVASTVVPATRMGKDLGDLGLLPEGRERYLPSLISALAVGELL